MSDGNFNRALLPHTPYHSGLLTGRQQMKRLALDTLEALFQGETCTMDEEQKRVWRETFERELKVKI